MEYLSIFIDIINDHLALENITINQFSKQIGIVERAIAKWMTLEYFPNIDCVIKVADYFNCSVDYLFGLTDKPSICISKMPVTFIARFKMLISDHKLTAYRIAKDCNIGESAISKWQKGVYPKTKTLIILAKYFSCSVDYLIGRED